MNDYRAPNRVRNFRGSFPHRWSLYVASFIVMVLGGCGAIEAQDPARKPTTVEALRGNFSASLGQLAARLRSEGKIDQAEHVASCEILRVPDRSYLFVPGHLSPEQVEVASDRDFAEPGDLIQLRKGFAQDLWKLAEQSLREGDWQTAYRMAHEVLHEDPQHAAARLVVGTTYEYADAGSIPKRGRVRLKDLGWAAGSYWQFPTPHFVVVSQGAPETVPAVAAELETLYTAWRQLFPESVMTKFRIEQAFRGRGPSVNKKRHRVVVFRDRQGYNDWLHAREPQVGLTLGMYRAQDRTSYFYDSKADLRGTWRHEATHQLFFEHGPGVEQIGERANFWIVEGIAVYMESLQRFKGYVTVGGVDAPRLQHARYRALNSGESVSLAEITAFTRVGLQAHADIRALYSHFAGMTHFLMDFDRGRHRKLVGPYLHAVYSGRDEPGTFAANRGTDLEAMDRAYRDDFLKVNDERLRALAASQSVRKLVLGHCPVTADGVRRLGNLRLENLRWLDLTACPVDDQALAWLPRASRLEQLSLEATHITNASLARIGQLKSLRELDLSSTNVTDEGIQQLESLPSLRILYVTNTRVSDTAIARLKSALPKLEASR